MKLSRKAAAEGFTPSMQRLLSMKKTDRRTVLSKVIDFVHILMYIKLRKRDNVKEGVPLPLKKAEH